MVGDTNCKEDVHKCSWVSEVNGEKTLRDYVLDSRLFKDRFKDVYVMRGVSGGVSDPFGGSKVEVKI